MTSRLLERVTVTPFDSLIVAAGAGQSYFGNDQFAEFAPGMKTIDDALELRGRILAAFEQAELSDDPAERARLLTFVVVGAGPTGVELAGQIAELSRRTLDGAFRKIDPREARVVLLDGAPAVLPVYGGKLSRKAAETLEKLGVEIQLDAMVTDVDNDGLIIKEKDGTLRRIESQCKVWSAGVQASPLGKQLAEQSGGETDRAGRVMVNPDLSLPGHPNVFVIGDMMSLDKLPGLAQVAMQGGKYAAKQIKASLDGKSPSERVPFKYFDKGSMATISRFSAVAKVGKLRDQRLHRVGCLAGNSPPLPRRIPFPCLDAVVMGGDVLRAWPCSDGVHRAAGLRAKRDGRIGEEKQGSDGVRQRFEWRSQEGCRQAAEGRRLINT